MDNIFKTLPVGFKHDFSLAEVDEEYQRAKVMLSIFKELMKRQEEHPSDCPWCKKELKND
ncbi:hypothetical protein HOD61_01535 [archaeon]|jgi:hypothetical protein|nr:hypothetical protein [archaeon]